MNPEMDWGNQTVPQDHVNGRKIDYSRGKGLGGSTAINFGLYNVGAEADYDLWARIVDDENFNWKNMQRRFKSLETFHDQDIDPPHAKYLDAKPSDHGHEGGLHLGFAQEWEKDVSHLIDAFEKAGYPLNQDHNSGNPIGMALAHNSAYRGVRTMAADLLVDAPDNLTISTHSPVRHIIIEDRKAIGVESDGRKCESSPRKAILIVFADLTISDYAAKEVILCTGTLDSPKILMHSGIGPAAELEQHNINVIQDVPAIGRNLRDHIALGLVFLRKEGTNDGAAFYGNPDAMEAALQQWKENSTGGWSSFGCQRGIGWFKLDKLNDTEEFKALTASEQSFLHEDTVPHYELYTHFPAHMFNPEMPTNLTYNALFIFLMNEQSRGEVRLQSSNPGEPLLFDPKFFSHPFDRRAAIEILRSLLAFTTQPAYADDTIAAIHAPKSDSDEDLLEFWHDNLISVWHMNGTVKMGKKHDKDAAVDSRSRVRGIQNLRIADMSIVPILPNNHTQITAYVTGVSCADVLMKDYGLDQASS
jgi:choline dehydrogenase-like flavoprotein